VIKKKKTSREYRNIMVKSNSKITSDFLGMEKEDGIFKRYEEKK